MITLEDEMHPDADDSIRLTQFGALTPILGMLLLVIAGLCLWAVFG